MLSDFSQGDFSAGLAEKDLVEQLLEVGEGPAQEEAWEEGSICYAPYK